MFLTFNLYFIMKTKNATATIILSCFAFIFFDKAAYSSNPDSATEYYENLNKESAWKVKEDSIARQYYNEVYLIFDRSFKQEIALIDAQSKLDIKAMKQCKDSLIQYDNDGQKKLETLKGFKGDITLQSACTELLKFYQTCATDKFTEASNFIVEKEKFDKIRIPWEAKKENQKSERESNAFNQSLEEFNILQNKFKESNQEVSMTRDKFLEKWNWTSDRFKKKYLK